MAEMKYARRSGLVVRSEDEACVVTARQVAGALKKRARKLKDIAGTPVHVGDVTHIAQSTPEPYISTDALLDALDVSGRKYGLLSAPTAKTKNAIIFSRDHTINPPAGIAG